MNTMDHMKFLYRLDGFTTALIALMFPVLTIAVLL